MPLQQTPTGLDIQPITEIKDELDQAHRDNLGADVALGPDSIFGQFIGIWSEREALIQAQLQFIQAAFSRDGAQGTNLDAISALFGSTRLAASASKSVSGRCTGVAATFIPNGSQVIQDVTTIVWNIVDGTDGISPFGYDIGGGGDVSPVTIEATTTGPNTFATASTFVIGTPVAGWTGFNVTSDIETFETGTDIESDGPFRTRGADEIFSGGNDTSGIKAAITRVKGVVEVQVFENRNCTVTSPDGIPPGAVESVVTGGDDLEVAAAILSRVPPGTETFGGVSNNLADIEGNLIDIQFTRPALIEIFVEMLITISGAEGTPPENASEVVNQAILDFGNANNAVGQDVLFQQFIGPAFDALKDIFTGKFVVQTIISRVGLTAPGAAEANIPISIRQRADYDSANILIQFF